MSKTILADKAVQKVENILRNPAVIIGAGVVVAVLSALAVGLAFPLYRPILSDPFWFPVCFGLIALLTILTATAACILAERKIAAFTQDRRGPNRVGFWGLLQPIADGMKFFFKEDITPAHVDRPIFFLAPFIALATSLVGFGIIPWAGAVHWPWMPAGETVSTQMFSLNVGVLYILAIGSLSVYGIVLAGYASNNKYSFFGGMRASAQMISYELPIGLALVCVLLAAGTLRLEAIVEQQALTGWWYAFMYPLPFLLFLVSSFAETNRAPFDLAEAEQELVGGFHTEYSSMKFAMFFLAEYAHMITGSAFMVAIFCGGWHFWGLPNVDDVTPLAMLIKLAVFVTKVVLFIVFFMIIRWTIPRFRFDQLMRLAWQGMIPAGIVLVGAIAILTYFGLQRTWWAAIGVNVLTLLVMLWKVATSASPVTGRQESLPEIDVRPT
jgi:NADH-quinone oxidoreductase subunit H